MKVIFLDFDGVINNMDSKQLVNETYVENLKKIMHATGAKVVVSLERKNEFMKNPNIDYTTTFYYTNFEIPLKNLGIEIFDYTPFVDVEKRMKKEAEIQAYLSMHPEIEEFAILDDAYVISKYQEHQVFVEYFYGLEIEHVEAAISILNGQLEFYPPNYDIEEGLMERAGRILDTNSFESDLPKDNLDKIERILSKYSDLKL